MDATTSRLADFALQARFSELPPETVHACKQRLIDSFACVFGAYEEPLGRMARAVALRYKGTPAATIWGGSSQTSPEAAAFANGVMVRLLDISDTHLGKSRGHPSDVISGILAVGEAVHADGPSIINAVTLAYDVYCSFCDAIDINSMGWDQPIYAGIGCALGAGKLLGLSRDQLGNAVALSLAPNMALFQTRTGDLSGWKGCASANAVRNAVFAAMLAKDGFTGPTAVFEGKSGLWDIVGRFDWQLPAAGAPHRITRTHMKSFPICYHGQSAVWAALELRKRVSAADIAGIQVETYRQAVAMMGSDPSRWAPTTRDTADHSLPYVIATALLDGEVVSRSFTRDKLQSPAVADLMRKVSVSEDAQLSAQYPDCAACRLKVRTRAGESVVIELKHAKGHVNAPMDDADIERKFRGMFRELGDESECAPMLRALLSLERSADIGDVLRLFRLSSDNQRVALTA